MDARRLDHRTLTELRKRAVGSVQDGESPDVVARALSISRATSMSTTGAKLGVYPNG